MPKFIWISTVIPVCWHLTKGCENQPGSDAIMRMEHADELSETRQYECVISFHHSPCKDMWEGWNPQHRGSLLARNWPYGHQHFGLSVSTTMKQCYPVSRNFVFWAIKYAYPDFFGEVTFAYLEISLYLSSSDSIGFWKILSRIFTYEWCSFSPQVQGTGVVYSLPQWVLIWT